MSRPSIYDAKGIGPTQLSNSAATVYTVPASRSFRLECILITNTSGSAATVTVSIGTDAASKRILAAVSVPANDILSWDGKLILMTGTVIQAYSGTNAVLNLSASGVEIG